MKIYWRFEIQRPDGWETIAENTEESIDLGYGWNKVAAEIRGAHSIGVEDFDYTKTRVLIWSADVKKRKRNLDNLLHAEYGFWADARDIINDGMYDMLERLQRWGAIEDFGFYPDGAGDHWTYQVVNGYEDGNFSDTVMLELNAFEVGWLAARSVSTPNEEPQPDEAESVVMRHKAYRNNHEIEVLRTVGGEVWDRYTAAATECGKVRAEHGFQGLEADAAQLRLKEFRRSLLVEIGHIHEDDEEN